MCVCFRVRGECVCCVYVHVCMYMQVHVTVGIHV